MVCCSVWQDKEKNYPWTSYHNLGEEAENVLFSWMAWFESSLQEVWCYWHTLSVFVVEYLFHNIFRYASLYFCCAIEQQDNELLTLEIIHRYVELLDKYFGSVSYCYTLFRKNTSWLIYNHCFIYFSLGVWARHNF